MVLLEVPSGYLSDLAGRRITLVLSSLFALAAYVLFVSADGFGLLVAAQCFLAGHIAFRSGTDSSMLYESLADAGEKARIGPELARAQRIGLLSMGTAALIGGIAGGLDLALPYLFAACSAATALLLAFQFVEPGGANRARAGGVGAQLGVIAQNLQRPDLRWLFYFSVMIFVLVHVPYEFFQPYIRLLFPPGSDYDTSPLVAGVLIAVTMILGSAASGLSMPLQRRFGTATALLLIILMAVGVIILMASSLHLLVLAPIMLRSVPMAMASPIVNSILHQSIDDHVRASFLSTLSLLSRLAFSLTLLVTAVLIGTPEQLDFPLMRWILAGYAIAAGILLPALIAGRRQIRKIRDSDQ